MQVDHLVSYMNNKGKDDISNYMPSCKLCNKAKIDYTIEQFRTYIEKDAPRIHFKKSRKINGLRCCFYWDGKHIKTYSRGGENYDLSTQHLTKHPILIEIFKKFPTLVLDSELYKHGKSLQQISGAARLERNAAVS